jgi:hypothetical protein
LKTGEDSNPTDTMWPFRWPRFGTRGAGSSFQGQPRTSSKRCLDKQAEGLDADLKVAQDKLAEMNRAAARRCRDFEGDVNDAMARLRKSLESSSG